MRLLKDKVTKHGLVAGDISASLPGPSLPGNLGSPGNEMKDDNQSSSFVFDSECEIVF